MVALTDLLGTYVAGRERVHGRPGRISFDVPAAASQLTESMGPHRAQRWALDLLTELQQTDTITPEFIVELACIAAGLEDDGEGGDADVIERVIRIFLGHA